MYWIGVVTAAMTAFYVFRAIFLTFFGTYRGEAHAHESPPVMTLPLVVLALLSLGGGALQVSNWLEPVFPRAELAENPALVYISTGAGLAGVLLAWVMYVWRPSLPDAIAGRLGWLYTLVAHKYFVDEIYGAAVVRPAVDGSRAVLWRGMDQELIDGAVNGVADRATSIGVVLRHVQSGNIRTYAACVLFGAVCVLIALGVTGGLR
jgi:NADH-quinone oxidoreductase subunit L